MIGKEKTMSFYENDGSFGEIDLESLNINLYDIRKVDGEYLYLSRILNKEESGDYNCKCYIFEKFNIKYNHINDIVKRNFLQDRYLRFEFDIDINIDYDFLYNFVEFRYILDNYKDSKIRYEDWGKHFNVEWVLVVKCDSGENITSSSRVSNNAISNKIMEIFPYTEEELNKINSKYKSKIYTPDTIAPGKHKGKAWKEVKLEDPQYVNWMISVTKDKNLKNMLLSL